MIHWRRDRLPTPVFLGFPCGSAGRVCPQCGRPEFYLWVGKIPWRRERLPTSVFWPGEFHGVAKSRTGLSDFQRERNITLQCRKKGIQFSYHVFLHFSHGRACDVKFYVNRKRPDLRFREALFSWVHFVFCWAGKHRGRWHSIRMRPRGREIKIHYMAGRLSQT